MVLDSNKNEENEESTLPKRVRKVSNKSCSHYFPVRSSRSNALSYILPFSMSVKTTNPRCPPGASKMQGRSQGQGLSFFTECYLRVRFRSRVRDRLALLRVRVTVSVNPNPKTAFFKKNIDPDPGPDPCFTDTHPHPSVHFKIKMVA